MCQALESTPGELFGAAGPGFSLRPAPVGEWTDSSEPSTGRDVPSPPVRQLLDLARFSPVEETAANSAALDGPRRAELVSTLDDRHRQLGRWTQDLEARHDRLERTPAPSRSAVPRPVDLRFPAAAAAAQIAILVVDTGDDLDTVAAGLGMSPEWVHGVVEGRIDSLDASEARRLCRGLGLTPTEVFGPAGGALAPGDAADFSPSTRTVSAGPAVEPGPSAPATPDVADLDFGPY